MTSVGRATIRSAPQPEDLGGRRAGRRGLGEGPPGRRLKRLAGGGQPHASAHTLEQVHPEFTFGRFRMLWDRDGCVTCSAARPRAREAPVVDGRDDVGELAQLHRSSGRSPKG